MLTSGGKKKLEVRKYPFKGACKLFCFPACGVGVMK